jgi:hypothetical protein
MQTFIINQNSVLPTLCMDLLYDGRSDFNKFYDAIQDSTITFTMTNIDTNIVKVANAPCYIKLRENEGCTEQYIICYDWKPRDTKEKGSYEGVFTIHFNGNLNGESISFPSGDLIVPIREKLIITIQ